jgi:hypothetical protein
VTVVSPAATLYAAHVSIPPAPEKKFRFTTRFHILIPSETELTVVLVPADTIHKTNKFPAVTPLRVIWVVRLVASVEMAD